MALSSASSKITISGIPNHGNSCFLNVVIQSFAALKPLKERLGKITQKQQLELKTISRLSAVLSAINTSREPNAKDIRYLGGRFLENHQQQDAHEYMQYIISQIIDDEKQIARPNQSNSGFNILSLYNNQQTSKIYQGQSQNKERNPFEGLITSELRFPKKECAHPSSVTEQPFFDLSLSIGRSLKECLDYFTQEEIINGVYCEKCYEESKVKNHTTAVKRMLIAKMPEILCFQIRRLISTEFGPRKIETPVAFPIELDMASYCITTQTKDMSLYRSSIIIPKLPIRKSTTTTTPITTSTTTTGRSVATIPGTTSTSTTKKILTTKPKTTTTTNTTTTLPKITTATTTTTPKPTTTTTANATTTTTATKKTTAAIKKSSSSGASTTTTTTSTTGGSKSSNVSVGKSTTHHKQPIVGGSSGYSAENPSSTTTETTSINGDDKYSGIFPKYKTMGLFNAAQQQQQNTQLKVSNTTTTNNNTITTNNSNNINNNNNSMMMMNPSIMYRLCSVIVHEGGHNGGHYIVYRRPEDASWDSKEWFKISDRVVVPVHQDDVLSAQAYMLYYVKKDSLKMKAPTF